MGNFKTIESYINYVISNTCIKSIYPASIFKNVDYSTKEEILDVCCRYEDEGKLVPIYELRCPECNSILGTYDYYADIPENFEYCKYCNQNIETKRLDNSVILFKILR